jgi:hypothetical protein
LLANSARSEVLALAAAFVVLQSANQRFVNRDHLAFAAKLHGEITVTPGLARTMAHEPRSFVRLLKGPMYLMGTDALVARCIKCAA